MTRRRKLPRAAGGATALWLLVLVPWAANGRPRSASGGWAREVVDGAFDALFDTLFNRLLDALFHSLL